MVERKHRKATFDQSQIRYRKTWQTGDRMPGEQTEIQKEDAEEEEGTQTK